MYLGAGLLFLFAVLQSWSMEASGSERMPTDWGVSISQRSVTQGLEPMAGLSPQWLWAGIGCGSLLCSKLFTPVGTAINTEHLPGGFLPSLFVMTLLQAMDEEMRASVNAGVVLLYKHHLRK